MANKEQQKNQFQLNVGTDSDSIDPKDDERWMTSQQRDKFTTMLTNCFRKVMDDWHPHESCRVVSAIERLLFRSIDMELLMKKRVFKEGVTFSFNVMEHIGSDDLFDLLLEYHPDKWMYIQNEF